MLFCKKGSLTRCQVNGKLSLVRKPRKSLHSPSRGEATACVEATRWPQACVWLL